MLRINGLRGLVVTAAVALAAGLLALVAAGKLFGPASMTHGSSESNSLSAVQSDPEGEGEGGSALLFLVLPCLSSSTSAPSGGKLKEFELEAQS